ncbi:MAG TPA: DUF4149 domain-containing protein [Methylomirabilota bacterium]|nr:DUF4149 domain-containing protein [Methylomirabilota bacterium]
MSRFAHALAAATLGSALGVQLFLSFLVAPSAFRLLDRPAAVRLMEGLFPGYYTFGLAAGGVTLALALLLALGEGRAPLRWAAVILLTMVLLGTTYAGQVLLPATAAARLRAQTAAAGDLAPLEFSRLHRRAVAVNIALFGVGALALLVHAAARPRDGARPA